MTSTIGFALHDTLFYKPDLKILWLLLKLKLTEIVKEGWLTSWFFVVE